MDNSISTQIEKLMKLKQLYESGVLTNEEMEAEKQKILGDNKRNQKSAEDETPILDELDSEIDESNKEWDRIINDQNNNHSTLRSDRIIIPESLHNHIFPIIISAVFIAGWTYFHCTYLYTDYWIDEWIITCVIFGVLVLILSAYYYISNRRERKSN